MILVKKLCSVSVNLPRRYVVFMVCFFSIFLILEMFKIQNKKLGSHLCSGGENEDVDFSWFRLA